MLHVKHLKDEPPLFPIAATHTPLRGLQNATMQRPPWMRPSPPHTFDHESVATLESKMLQTVASDATYDSEGCYVRQTFCLNQLLEFVVKFCFAEPTFGFATPLTSFATTGDGIFRYIIHEEDATL